MPLGVVDVLQVACVTCFFNASLGRDDFVVAGHDGYGSVFEALGQVHGAQDEVIVLAFEAFIQLDVCKTGVLRGLLGSLLWLVVPVSLCAAGPRAPILGILGALLLMAVAAILPFLQAEFARQDRIRVFLEPGQVREAFRSAPLAFLFALTLALVLPVPLYLLKIEMLPSEAGTLASFVFIVFMIPSRLLTGWALARGLRREERGHVILRGGARLAMVPVLALYVGLVFASRLISWEGVAAMYSQHAFLLPVPFSSFS